MVDDYFVREDDFLPFTCDGGQLVVPRFPEGPSATIRQPVPHCLRVRNHSLNFLEESGSHKLHFEVPSHGPNLPLSLTGYFS